MFRYVRTSSSCDDYVLVVVRYIKDPTVVDDASALNFAYAIVEMRASRKFRHRKLLASTAEWMLGHERKEAWSYAAIWILSKYGTQKQIRRAIMQTYDVWRSDYSFGRLVASLYAVINDGASLRELIRSARNSGADEMLDFLDAVHSDKKKTVALLNILLKNNPSFPNKVSHSKWTVLLSVLRSPVVDKALKMRLKNVHQVALSDRCYAARSRQLVTI